MFKEVIVNLLEKETRLKGSEIENLIEIPPSDELGDYAFPCFILNKKEKEAPNKIAQRIVKNLFPKLPKEITDIQSTGPYVNFFINKEFLAREIIKINANYGKNKIGKKQRIVIDFSHPNVGKPMHIGHIRSTIIGDSLMRIYNFLGYNPIGINYLGDVGLHIGKLIVAYELWLDKEELIKNPTRELLRLYIKFCGKEKSEAKEGLEDEEEFSDNKYTNKAREELKKLELGDKKAHKIWQDIQKHSGKAFDKVYDLLKVDFTETTGQSYFSKKGKLIISKAILQGHAKAESSGAVFLESHGTKKYILKTGKVASYMTQDIGAAVERFEKYNFEKMIYVVDFRQSEHFKHLFNILKIFGYEFTDKMYHLPFGTVKFGKEILATRKGNIILLEDVLNKTIEKAKQGISKRKTKGDPKKVGVAAIKYIILKNEPQKDVSFSWEEALNFEGNTGPYLQYSYARASSIIKKAEKQNFNKSIKTIPKLCNEEISLLKTIDKFSQTAEDAGKQMNPALIANYTYELAKYFSEFYHNCKVIGHENESFRLKLIDAFRTTLHNALHLLGIEVMEEM